MSKKKKRHRLNSCQFQPNRLSDELERLGLGPESLPEESARSTQKVEGKDSQLPVLTPSARELRPGYLKLFGPLDTKKNEYPFLWWIPEREARQRRRAGEVEKLDFSKRRLYAVHMIEKAPPAGSPVPASPDPQKPISLRRKSLGDSHKRERADNPPGVWTIDSLPRTVTKKGVVLEKGVFVAKVFDRVLIDLLYGPEYSKRAA